jgi:hypothetical protein
MVGVDYPHWSGALFVQATGPNQVTTRAPKPAVANLSIEVKHTIEQAWLIYWLGSLCEHRYFLSSGKQSRQPS